MSQKTITKNFAFVISFSLVSLIFSACSAVSSSEKETAANSHKKFSIDYAAPQKVGKFESGEITESSGIVASRCNQNAFWTHNDSGNPNLIYAFNIKGEHLGAWRVAGAKNKDWEDIGTFQNAKGECFLYLGDIGNNVRDREELIIYRFKEPQILEANKSNDKTNPENTETAEAITINYPDTRHDAETLIVHPQSGDIYVLTKRISGAAGVYRLKADYVIDKTNTLEKITDFSVPAVPNGLLTGGGITADGKRVIICDYFNAYELKLPESAKNFDEIWRQELSVVKLGERAQGEAICYSLDGRSIVATSERKKSAIVEVKIK
ncbi:MAG: hypothetical protein M3Q99_01450 [Acidobacteriota bacterium]|nr:hypothetical protein [Acidobacteriota bacterium]